MWRNYLVVGIRALLKSKTYAFITVFGMALALGPCLILLLFIRHETSYDQWIPGADRAFQIQTVMVQGRLGAPPRVSQTTSFIARDLMVKDFPQILSSVYAANLDGYAVVLGQGEPSVVDNIELVDGNLFDILRFPFAKGDPAHALDRPGDIVLTEREAGKRFPGQDPIGKTLTLAIDSHPPADYRVTGILRDLPTNTHMRLGMVARYDPASFYARKIKFSGGDDLKNWYFARGRAYAKLRPGASAAAINAQLPAWEKRNISRSDPMNQFSPPGESMDWRLTNVRDIHLGPAGGEWNTGSDRRTIATFGLVGLLILGMAVVNFVNLATARGAQRAREVALRKVAGANRRQLIVQFLLESILLTGVAMLLGLAIAELLLPRINAFLDIEMAFRYVGRDGVLLPIIVLTLLVGTVAGLHPAFFLSRFKPALILKANRSAAEARGSGRLRGLLVVGQFAISIGLILCTAIIYAQTRYARAADEGYRRQGLIQVGTIDPTVTPSQKEALRREVGRIPGVRQASLSGVAVNTDPMAWGFRLPGKPDIVTVGVYNVDANFFRTMGMTLLAGRNFDERNGLDHYIPRDGSHMFTREEIARTTNVIMSEAAANIFGFTKPQTAIGKEVKAIGPSFTIVGMVANARLRSVRGPFEPVVYTLSTHDVSTLMLRYDAPDPARIMAELARTWRRVIPTLPFNAEYVDDRVREIYQPEEARGRLFGAFALVAVAIACLGLFGLAAFTAERRTKEIGIRKVLGAKTQDIVRLLAWQFTRPVLIANIIAWPVAWWLMRDWLNGFDARIAFSPAYFLFAGALALIIALGTIAGHALKVARAKPIRALRYE